MLRGRCEHMVFRWRYVPCGKRDCPHCGRVGRYRIAERIALGVRQFWPAAWLVLTFKTDIDKKAAVRRVGALVRWLRKRTGTSLEYAATYELTRRGRLHVNLVIGPWSYVPLPELVAQWGARVSVEWVRDAGVAGTEAAKSYSPEGLGGYLSKLEQSVPEDRRVSYSRGWPKLPKGGAPRRGRVVWSKPELEETLIFKTELACSALWAETRPGSGEWRVYREDCDCFEYEDG